MKSGIFLIILLFLQVTLIANQLPVVFAYEQDKDVSQRAKRWHIPTLISEEEKAETKNKKQKEQAKIDKNFTQEKKITKVDKVKTEIRTDNAEADFFNRLSEEKNTPMNME